MSDSGSAEEGDEIIGRVPVSFKRLEGGKKMVLLQYGLREKDAGYSSILGEAKDVRIRSDLGAVQMEFDLSSFGKHGGGSSDTFKLRSREISSLLKNEESRGNYGVGIIHDGRFHLLPLDKVFQMIPDFGHLESSKLETQSLQNVSEESKEERRIDIRAKKIKMGQEKDYVSFSNVEDREQSHAWISLECEDTAEESVNLFQVPLVPLEYSHTDEKQYLEVISGRGRTDEPNNQLLESKCLSILENAEIAPFNMLCRRLNCTSFHELDMLLGVLQEHCYCICGSWVLKESKCFSGRLNTCRDYLLSLMSESDGHLILESFMKETRLCFEDMMRLLESIAVPEGTDRKNWTLKYPKDERFESEFGELLSVQRSELRKCGNRALEVLRRGVPLNVLAKANSSRGSENELALARKQLITFLRSNFENFGVCSLSFLQEELDSLSQDLSLDDNQLHLVTSSIFEFHLLQEATNITGDLYCRRKLNNPTIDKYRDCFISFLGQQQHKSPAEFRRSDVRKFIHESIGASIEDRQWRSFCAEFCDKTDSAAMYTLKQGNGA